MSAEREYHCEGCGISVQTEEPSALGYVPPAALEREMVLCQRCYRIRHYGEIGTVNQNPDIYLQKLGEIAGTDSLVVQVVDLFDFSGSWIPGIHRHIGDNPLLLLANKIDLFPRSTKWGRLREWLVQSARDLGITPIDVELCSAAKGLNMNETITAIEKYRQGRDVYIVGATNAGKSTFINRLLREVGGESQDVITTSPYPGTTLDAIRIPLEDGKAIVDTPGIVRRDRISEWVSPRDLKIVVPGETIRPKVYQLNDKQTLFLGGLARFDYVRGPRQPFVCYVSNRLYIHRTKLDHADVFQEKHCGGLLVPPADPEILPPWKKHVISLRGKEKQDVVIPGLGWIACGKEKATLHLWVPEGIRVMTRPAII
ncbi:ribosome biogenesis GTPase YqeH [Paenactinomyces guangxiensis]|uniref:Ribosome biogenesis GTPase YqeH n=1 Tax=Paenactinomyces guangxiensis TaxID=1490290 RepID=A0A7W1WND2_9BACL|nr:ribosome biogenesis GTPase YqeH [Paenactinomyces guangxiensis]MBA4493074.1 ribosome biogenesis GTPase YqeH [Paenactinomyces guangxiensis]MBH8590076.1 ribosome biogenesis GTPase YqeH [Paenactinomyces guangxiensis]